MARGVFAGKPRALQPPDAISSPVLSYTDAQPRNDLQNIQDGSSHERTAPRRAVAYWDFQRPRTSERVQNQGPQGPNPGFDLRINVPPTETVLSPTNTEKGMNENMIGIALGSPGLTQSPNTPSQARANPSPATRTEKPKQTPTRKSSKWKKIGGFFKAKHALSSTANQPFYQVRVNNDWPLQGSTHSIDDGVDSKAETPSQVKSNQDSQKDDKESHESWPRLTPETESKSHDGQLKAVTPRPLTKEQRSKSEPGKAGGLLQVEIPDVQLERYSVMFGGVLNKDQRSPSPRRSKTLDDVTPPTPSKAEPSGNSPKAHKPQQQSVSQSHRAKSPSFTLFPSTHVSKQSKILGSSNLPRGPSPITRSQTSLSGLIQECASQECVPDEKTGDSAIPRSPSEKSPSTHRSQNSKSPSISSASIEQQQDEKLPQMSKTPKSPRSPHDRDQASLKDDAGKKELQSLKIDTKNLAPRPANSRSASASSASSSPMLSPLDATREKVDRIMSPSGNKSAVSPKFAASPKSAVSPAESTRMPLSDDNDNENEADDTNPTDPLPKIEVSIARSVSVSKGRKQVLVPVRPRSDRLTPDERLVDNRARMVQVTDAHLGHRHGNSQDARIETI